MEKGDPARESAAAIFLERDWPRMDSSRTGKCFILVHVLVFAVAMYTCVVGEGGTWLCQPEFTVS